MPLFIAPLDCDLKIIKMLVDGRTKKHLENLGITIDSTIRVLSSCGGNVICQVKDCRMALDNDIASRIIVTSVESEECINGKETKRIRRRRNRYCEKSRGAGKNPPSAI